MAYVNAFDPTTPSATDPADQGDDEIRRIKAALIERLETVFTDIDADPLEPLPGIFGGSDEDVATYLVDNAAGTRATALSSPAIILFLKISGTTDGSGAVAVDFNESGFGGKYLLSKLQSIVAMSRAGAATGTRISINTGTNVLTLDTDYAVATAVTWDAILVFTP